MKDQEWFGYFDAVVHKFKWFFDDYGFGGWWTMLLMARVKEDRDKMLQIMNDVWFLLPDGRFNIMENPDGWSEYLALLEA